MTYKIYILLFGLLLLQFHAFGQIPDSILQKENSNLQAIQIPTDSSELITPPTIDSTTKASKKKFGFRFIKNAFSKEDYPNPKKALYLSMAIPGGGQIYNKRWWKLPFVYGGYAALIYAVDFNTKRYKTFRDAYIAELADQPHSLSSSGLDANDFRQLRDGYDKNRQLSYVGILALHLIQTAEAFVDCHLKTFDVSDDLSMKVGPKIQMMGDGSTMMGVGLRFQLSD